MGNECSGPSMVEIRVTHSECSMMPKNDTIILEGPRIDYEKSGPVCITALNAIYPWIMVSRFKVETGALDYDKENQCYHGVCPCGTVHFDIKNII